MHPGVAVLDAILANMLVGAGELDLICVLAAFGRHANLSGGALDGLR